MDPARVVEAAEDDPLLTGRLRYMVLATVKELANDATDDGMVAPGGTELSERWGISRQSVIHRLNRTVEVGYLRDTGKMLDQRTVYELTIPETARPPTPEVKTSELEETVLSSLLHRVDALAAEVADLRGRIRHLEER